MESSRGQGPQHPGAQRSDAGWYVAIDEKSWIGPFTIVDIVDRIYRQELTWAHFAWKKDQHQWQRLCEISVFSAAVPVQPNKILEIEVKRKVLTSGRPTKSDEPLKRGVADPLWFLHYNSSQFGPFSSEEVRRFLRIGKIHGEVHAWTNGMAKWGRLGEIELFADSVAEAARLKSSKAQKTESKGAQASTEKRKTPRYPLVARTLLANDESMVVAMCRDVSIGGMQVLTDHIPGKVGTHLKLNVSPPFGAAGTEKKKIEPFVAEGTIVRILEDGRGFSFRFSRLSVGAVESIERYVDDDK